MTIDICEKNQAPRAQAPGGNFFRRLAPKENHRKSTYSLVQIFDRIYNIGKGRYPYAYLDFVPYILEFSEAKCGE